MNRSNGVLRLWPWLAAITSGIFCRLCFAPHDQAWLCWLALTPLLSAVWFSGNETKRRWLRDLSLGYVAGVSFFWTVFAWLTTVTGLGWFMVGAYMGIYFALWTLLCGLLRPRRRKPTPLAGLEAVTRKLEGKRAAERGVSIESSAPNESLLSSSPWLSSYRNLGLAILLASVWVALETVRGTLFSGWGWNTLGTALHAQWAMIQIVDITGVPGLSFLVCLTNVVLVLTVRRFIEESHVQSRRPHFEFTLTMAAIVGVMAYGIRTVQTPQETTIVRVAVLQPDVPREQKFSREFAQDTFDKFTRLSETALASKPDLLVWPESSMPGPVLEDEESYRFVTDFSKRVKTDLLLGAIDVDQTAAYNAALLVSKGGENVQLYRKVHLVPFGEYVPGRNTLPGIARIVGDQVPEDFGVGHEYTVFKLTRGDVHLAPLICFEDTIGELTRQFVLHGANLLANVTNDGWFLRTSGSRQHLDNAVFRCVETRLPMVRSANTGVTCFVNEFGRVTQMLVDSSGSQFVEGVLSGEVRVPIDYEPTFYVRHGEWFAKVCLAITAALFTFLALQRLRRRFSKTT
ncbi:MAG: apolipoprotein N-acyltransferase [Chthoniobacterales bacterium]